MMENSISNIRLSLLLPTRGRPDRLRQVLNSIEATAAQKYNLIVNIYVDDDDTDTLSFSKAAALSQEYHYFIQWHVACRVSSMGAMVNELVRVSPEADIYMQVADDYMFATEAWDDVLRRVALQYSDGIWLAYPHDPTSPGDVTFIIMGARWIELTGRFLTPHFAFWFDDLWLDQVAPSSGDGLH